MGRIADIITNIRDSLSDADGDRWSDARLLRAINEGQIELVVRNGLLRTKYDISIIVDVNEYELPTEAVNITRVVNSDGERIPTRSHSQMDEVDELWEVTTGSTIEFIVFDKQNPGQFKVYPIPDASDDSDAFVVGAYGIVVDIQDDTLTSVYGIVVDVNETATLKRQFNSIYGIVTDMSAVTTSLVIYYQKRPAEINAIDTGTSQLDVDEIYDIALKHYAIGMCWRDDQDTQNRALANDELAMFVQGDERAKRQSGNDNTRLAKQTTVYNNGFE